MEISLQLAACMLIPQICQPAGFIFTQITYFHRKYCICSQKRKSAKAIFQQKIELCSISLAPPSHWYAFSSFHSLYTFSSSRQFNQDIFLPPFPEIFHPQPVSSSSDSDQIPVLSTGRLKKTRFSVFLSSKVRKWISCNLP